MKAIFSVTVQHKRFNASLVNVYCFSNNKNDNLICERMVLFNSWGLVSIKLILLPLNFIFEWFCQVFCFKTEAPVQTQTLRSIPCKEMKIQKDFIINNYLAIS